VLELGSTTALAARYARVLPAPHARGVGCSSSSLLPPPASHGAEACLHLVAGARGLAPLLLRVCSRRSLPPPNVRTIHRTPLGLPCRSTRRSAGCSSRSSLAALRMLATRARGKGLVWLVRLEGLCIGELKCTQVHFSITVAQVIMIMLSCWYYLTDASWPSSCIQTSVSRICLFLS
jgi:hypothetical protein